MPFKGEAHRPLMKLQHFLTMHSHLQPWSTVCYSEQIPALFLSFWQ